MSKPITHLFENHLQYGDRQFSYESFVPSITFKQFKEIMERNKEEEYE